MNNYRVSVITVANENVVDENSFKIVNAVEEKGLRMVSYDVLPQKGKVISNKLRSLCDSSSTDMILIMVDKNISKKHIINEAIESVIEEDDDIIDERIRQEVLINTGGKVSIDGISGIRNRTMIINIPDNIKGTLGSIIDLGIKELEKEIIFNIGGEEDECY